MRTTTALTVALIVLTACRSEPDAVPASTPPPSTAGRALASTEPAPTEPASRAARTTEPTVLAPFPGVRITLDAADTTVALESHVCIEAGWLEQIACAAGTREHESLMVPTATASQVHASLLAAGFEAGSPGAWSWEGEELRFTAPTGTALDLRVRYRNAEGDEVEEPVRRWIKDHQGRAEFPDAPWVFAGSRLEPNPDEGGDPPEFYVADFTGSIVGLVTFGDEVVAFSQVLADLADVQPAEWQADDEYIPPVGTEVTLLIRRARSAVSSQDR